MNLIYDRTQSDVMYVKTLRAKLQSGTATDGELNFWLNGIVRGAYNSTDLNRVEDYVAVLQSLLLAAGYGLGDIITKTDWEIPDKPPVEQMHRYLTNIKKLVEVFLTTPAAASLPATMMDLNWAGANAIEETLAELTEALDLTRQIYIRSGAINAYSGTTTYIANGGA